MTKNEYGLSSLAVSVPLFAVFFKNLMLYRLADGWAMSAAALEELLQQQPLQGCTGINLMSRGWVPPREGYLVEVSGKHLMIALGVEQKLLPASVVKQETEARAQQLEQQQGYKPGKKQLRELKDRVTVELLPRAFAKRRVTRAWIDVENRLLVVDASSPNRAEEVLEKLRETLGELPVTPIQTQHSAQGMNTQWLTHGAAEPPFVLGEDAELRAPDDSGGTVRYLKHGLLGKDVRDHIAGGKQVIQLGLVWRDRVGFLLREPLSVKRVKFLEIERSRAEQGEMESQLADEQYAADFALMAGELGGLVKELVVALGGEQVNPSAQLGSALATITKILGDTKAQSADGA